MVAKQLVAPAEGTAPVWRDIYQVIGALNGYSDWGVEVTLTSLNSPTAYSQTIRNLGVGGHLLAQRSTDAATVLAVTDSGITAPLGATVGNLTVTGNETVGGTLGVTGTSTLGVVNAGATAVTTLHATVAATLDSTLSVAGLASLAALTATGNVALGDANTDVHTMIGVTTFRNTTPATQLLVDAGNNRVIVGSSTALGSDTTPCLQVVGRLYIAPETANDLALQVRRSSAATLGWNIGVTSANELVFKDLTAAETFRIGAVASTYQVIVTGAASITGTLNVTGPITTTTSIAATLGMSAGASSTFTGGVTVVSGGLTVTAGGLTVTSGATTIAEAMVLTGIISPAITAATNDWAPTGIATARVIRATPSAAWNLSGIAAPAGPVAQLISLMNVSGFNLTLVVNSVLSAVGNRFLLPGNVNMVLTPFASVDLWYDTASAFWRVLNGGPG